MKLSAIRRICSKNKTIQIIRSRSESFVGNGEAFYTLGSISGVDREALYTIFDIKESDAAKWDYSEHGGFPIDVDTEVRKEETPLLMSGLSLNIGGKTVTPAFLHTKEKIAFLDSAYYLPVQDEKDISLAKRQTADGQAYIVILKGFSVMGIIIPDRSFLERTDLYNAMKTTSDLLYNAMLGEGYLTSEQQSILT